MTYHNPVPTCTAISVNGYFPLYTTPSCAQTHAGGNGTYHTHLLNSITYYMPSGLVLGVTFFHGDYGVTTTVETTTDGIGSELQTSQTVNQDELIENYTPLDSSFTPREESDTEYIDVTGQVWTGQTHIIPGGKIMAGTIEENLNEELRAVTLIYLTPSGKQWCGSWHKSMLGTLMSGIARDKFGSGPDGKSEILSKKLIGDGKGLEGHGYKSCKDDDPYKPSWNCTSIGCMILPNWWTGPAQFTGPNAYANCVTECWSWKCGEFSLDWRPWLDIDFCYCIPTQGTGATQTYPTYALCDAATQTEPCCTDDYNTYNCTLNGCEVHVGPGFGTYHSSPYALWECQQECRAWGCHDVYTSSAATVTGYSFQNYTFMTPNVSGATGYTAIGWTGVPNTNTTVIGQSTDLCIHVYYDDTSMSDTLIRNAEQAITDWRDQEMVPGGLLEHWRGIFINTNVQQTSTVVNGVGGTRVGGENWLHWPKYTTDIVENNGGAMPCISDPQNNTNAVMLPQSFSQLSQMSCSCRNVLVISLIDESNDGPGTTTGYNAGNSDYNPTSHFDTHRQDYIDKFNIWTSFGGTLYHLVYPASAYNNAGNIAQAMQIFLATQGNRFDTANNGNVLTYDPMHGNVSEINGNPIFGNPAQTNFTPLTPWPYAPSEVHNYQSWIETPWSTNPTLLGGNPFLELDSFGNVYEPLEDYNTFTFCDRRGVGAFTLSGVGADIGTFVSQNPVTTTTHPIVWTSGQTVTASTTHWFTYTDYQTTAVTSTTVVTNWWLYDVCLSAETIQYIDYPYLFPSDCLELKCERPGYSCGPNGCYEQWNGEFFDESICEAACVSWSCVTKIGGLEPEAGWPQMPSGGQSPETCEGTIEDQMGNPLSLYHPVTGNTYDFVAHCFGLFQPFQGYPPNQGVLGGGLWDNTGTSWVQGVATTTIENGLVVHDLGGGNCKTWHPDPPSVPGRITKLREFKLVDLNGNTLYRHIVGVAGTQAVDIMNELSSGLGYGWGNILNVTPPPISPDWPNGMPSFVVGPGIPIDRLIAYGNNTTGDNNIKEFTVEVTVDGCPCEQLCYCDIITGIDAANTDIWPAYIQSQFPTLVLTPNARADCEDKCCEKVKTWKCPDSPNHRKLLCNNCPNGGGCYDPLDGSGIHSTQSDCEDDCAVSYNCFSATPISAVTTYSANTTCEHVDYTMAGGQYLYLLPYSGIPVSYFQEQEPTGTQNGNFTVAQDNFSGWTWGRWSDILGSGNPIIKEAFKFDYGAAQGVNFGGISNAFEAFIYIFDEKNGYHDTEFNKMGFWTGNLWDNDTTHTCEYPSPQGDKELGVMDGFRNNEFATMFCIDYEIRHNKRPWVATLDPLLNGVPHPYAVSYGGKYWVQGAATRCGRDAGEVTQYNSGPPDYLTIDNQERYMSHYIEDGASSEPGGNTRSPYLRYTFKSVKDLKEKIHWMYSQPDYVDTYGWSNLSLYEAGSSLGQSQNETNLQSGACTRLGRDLARLYNPGPMMSLCTDWQGNDYTVPHPSNGLKTVTPATPDGLQLKDFWSIGMFRNQHPGDDWAFTPFHNYWEFERRGETGVVEAYNGSTIRYNSFMTLGPGAYNLYPGVTSLGIYAYGQHLGPAKAYGLMGRSVSIHGNTSAVAGVGTVYNYLGPVLACQCEMPCYCEIINGDQGDYEFQNQCHSNCCPNYYYYICCQPDTNSGPTSIPPFQASCLYNLTNCQCPTGSHQVPCPW